MKNVIDRYLLKFDELNALFSEIDVTQKNEDEIIEFFIFWLLDAYLEGFAIAGYMLSDDIDRKYSESKIEKEIRKKFDGKDVVDRISEYMAVYDKEALKLVLNTEYHRLYVTGSFDRAELIGNAFKSWKTVRDFKVRPTHNYIDGITLPLNVPFFTFDGDSALYPGGFKNVENNANCRCILIYTRQ